MSDYTPSMGAVKVAYKNRRPGSAYVIGVQNPDPEGEFDRFIAKVKSDALREAADEWRKHLLAASSSYVCAESWLKVRADRVESGDGQ